MAAGPNITLLKRSPDVVTYEWWIDNGTAEGSPITLSSGLNALALPGVDPEWGPDRYQVKCYVFGRAACFAAIDVTTLAKDSPQGQVLNMNVYVSEGCDFLLITAA